MFVWILWMCCDYKTVYKKWMAVVIFAFCDLRSRATVDLSYGKLVQALRFGRLL